MTPDVQAGRNEAKLIVCPLPLAWESGHEYLLLATRLLLDSGANVRLALYAQGPALEWVEYTVHDLSLASRTGFLSRGQLIRSNPSIVALLPLRPVRRHIPRLARWSPRAVVHTQDADLSRLGDGALRFLVASRDLASLRDALGACL